MYTDIFKSVCIKKLELNNFFNLYSNNLLYHFRFTQIKFLTISLSVFILFHIFGF